MNTQNEINLLKTGSEKLMFLYTAFANHLYSSYDTN